MKNSRLLKMILKIKNNLKNDYIQKQKTRNSGWTGS